MFARRVVIASVAVVAGMAATPALPAQQEAPDGVQIVVVLDVSGSMGEYVLSEDLPLEMQEIRDRLEGLREQIDALDGDPTVVGLREQIEALEADPSLQNADAAFDAAGEATRRWLIDGGFGGYYEVTDALRTALAGLGCNEFLFASIMSATSPEEADTWIDMACGASLPDTDRRAIHDLVPFLDDPGYQALNRAQMDAYDAVDEVRRTLGIPELEVEVFEFLDAAGYYAMLDRVDGLQDDLDEEARRNGYPRKLELARLAVATLLDLSDLDRAAGAMQTDIALAVFSTEAELDEPMTDDLDAVREAIDRLVPLEQTNLGGGMTVALDELEEERDPTRPAAIILLSDGHSNEGMPIAEILATIPPRADGLDAVVCSAGFATTEEEVDADLLRGLAEETGGEYLFVTRGEELTSFFVACRQGLLGSVVERTTGAATPTPAPAGAIEVPDGSCELRAVVSFLDAAPTVVLIGPDGAAAGAAVQETGDVRVLTVTEPASGSWTAEVSSPAGDLLFSLVLSTRACPPATTTTAAAATTTVPPADSGGGGTGLMIALIVALLTGAGAIVVVLLRRRRAA